MRVSACVCLYACMYCVYTHVTPTYYVHGLVLQVYMSVDTFCVCLCIVGDIHSLVLMYVRMYAFVFLCQKVFVCSRLHVQIYMKPFVCVQYMYIRVDMGMVYTFTIVLSECMSPFMYIQVCINMRSCFYARLCA